MKTELITAYKSLSEKLKEKGRASDIGKAKRIVDCLQIITSSTEMKDEEFTNDLLDLLRDDPEMIKLAFVAIAFVTVMAINEGAV